QTRIALPAAARQEINDRVQGLGAAGREHVVDQSFQDQTRENFPDGHGSGSCDVGDDPCRLLGEATVILLLIVTRLALFRNHFLPRGGKSTLCCRTRRRWGKHWPVYRHVCRTSAVRGAQGKAPTARLA